MEHELKKQERAEFRGRSQRHDIKRTMNKEKMFVGSPPPKARLLGNSGPKHFCTRCAPSGLSRRKAEAIQHKHIAKNMNDDCFIGKCQIFKSPLIV